MYYENSLTTSLLNFKSLILKRQDRVHFVRIWGQTSGENFEGTALASKTRTCIVFLKMFLQYTVVFIHSE